MIKEDLVAERIAIEYYSEIIRQLGNEDPTACRLIEVILNQTAVDWNRSELNHREHGDHREISERSVLSVVKKSYCTNLLWFDLEKKKSTQMICPNCLQL